MRRADQGHSRALPPKLEQVLAAWRALNLSTHDDRSVRALQNRHAEGATVEQLAAAVEGAKHDEWLRQGRAKSPFAVVFASLETVERFDTAGQEHARKTEDAARLHALNFFRDECSSFWASAASDRRASAVAGSARRARPRRCLR